MRPSGIGKVDGQQIRPLLVADIVKGVLDEGHTAIPERVVESAMRDAR